MTVLYKWIASRSRSHAAAVPSHDGARDAEKDGKKKERRKKGSGENGGREGVQISAARAWKDGHVVL